jgi:thiosulfate reductase cytochrome b subunit
MQFIKKAVSGLIFNKRYIIISLISLFTALALNAFAETAKCTTCHEAGKSLKNSIHADMDCTDCHGKVTINDKAEQVHGQAPPKPECKSECHESVVKDYNKGLHAMESALYEGKNPQCSQCHGSHNIIKALDPKSQVFTQIRGMLKKSIHADLECSNCHEKFLFGKDRPKPACQTCHSDIAKIYDTSVHGKATGKGEKDAAFCYDCHGSHQIVKVTDIRSRVNKINLPIVCGKCHSNKKITGDKKHHISQPDAVNQFLESRHGQALIKRGLMAAPACNDCHGVHDIKPHGHPASPINHKNVPDTCGKCHGIIVDVYKKSIHGQLLLKGDPRGPVCIDCHTSHQIGTMSRVEFKVNSDKVCGKCHQKRLENYRETYHGKASALGQGKVAACFDCHGRHDIYPKKDSRSLLFRGKDENGVDKDSLLETCQKCHPKAGPNFAGYWTHASHSDKENYPILFYAFMAMTSLLLGTFAFFGVHSLLWLVRSIFLYTKNPKEFKEAKLRAKNDPEVYTRFRPVDRFIHALIIISFLTLVLTGMPLKFYETEWAKTLMNFFGGSQVAASVHRFAAMITIFYFTLHVIVMVTRVIRALRKTTVTPEGVRKRTSFKELILGPESPIPHLGDLRDFIAHQKFFFGKGPRPQFEKWTYWEKFDYMAVFWGVAVIGLSGLVMWFPEFFTKFLPGWSINIALVIHSDEALLAAGFIFTFHFFNVHFRPEKFPFDSVIFSGRISRAELEHERKAYLDRLIATNELEEIRVGDLWKEWKKIVHPMGYLAFSIGVALIIMVYIAIGARFFQ